MNLFPIAKFRYKNHRGEVALRTVSMESISWKETPGYGYKPGFFLDGWCHDKKARRSFALANIVPPATDPHGYLAIDFTK